MLIFDLGNLGTVQISGKETQTIEGSLVLNSEMASMSFENSDNTTSIGITEQGDLLLDAENGNVVVATPDGTDENAVVNVEYVNNVVGTIETALETI